MLIYLNLFKKKNLDKFNTRLTALNSRTIPSPLAASVYSDSAEIGSLHSPTVTLCGD